MANLQRQKKVSRNQQETIIDYLKTHENFKTRKFSSTFTADDFEKLWEELVNQLNCDGTGPSKTVDKWKKMLSDWKSNTKSKAARINKSKCGTGGGEQTTETLTDLEERLLSVWGKELTHGIPKADEFGLSLPRTVENTSQGTSEGNEVTEPLRRIQENSSCGSKSFCSTPCNNNRNDKENDIYLGLEDFTIEEPPDEESICFNSSIISNVDKKRKLEEQAKKSLEKRQKPNSATSKPRAELLNAANIVESLQESQNEIIKDMASSISRLADGTEELIKHQKNIENDNKQIIALHKEFILVQKENNRIEMLKLASQRHNNTLTQSLLDVVIKKHA